MTPDVVLWDCDGTLFDTEGLWDVARQACLAEWGVQLPDDHREHVVGTSMINTATYIKETTGLALPILEIGMAMEHRMLALVRETAPTWLPGAKELVEGLAQRGLRQALVSNSRTDYLDAILSHVAAHPFETVVAGDQVEHGKPSPEPYLLACTRLGVQPSDCLVVEDSPVGVAAGLAAGCPVVGVPNQHALQPGEGLTLRDTLAGVSVDTLLAAFRKPDQERKASS